MIEFVPPLIGCAVSNQNDSFTLLEATEECVINIPVRENAEQVVGCGNTHGSRCDKFDHFWVDRRSDPEGRRLRSARK